MLSMFKRLYGSSRGNAAYDAYKTRAIAHAEQRRTKPGAAADFCKTADIVFAAALAPDKPVLEDFVAGVPVEENNPVDACEVKVAVTLQGVAAGPGVDAHAASRICPAIRPIPICFRNSAPPFRLRVALAPLVHCGPLAAGHSSLADGPASTRVSMRSPCSWARGRKPARRRIRYLTHVREPRHKRKRAGLATGPFVSDRGLISRRGR